MLLAEYRNKNLSRCFPRLGLASLLLCLISGAILSFHYRPMGNVFQNVEEITSVVPYGRFFRQLHYASGQLFVILMSLHTLDHFLRRRYRTFGPRQWSLLIISLALCFLALFTGFILKGDKEGLFAARIFMNILRTVPLVGNRLSNFFILPGDSLFFLPYLYHCIFLPPLIFYLLNAHTREWLPDASFLLVTTVGLFLFAIFIDPWMDIPPDAIVGLVKGPWFFLGIQCLLRFLPPFYAGLLVPGMVVLCIFLLPVAGKRLGKCLHYSILGVLILYALLTLKEFLFGP